MGRTGGLLLGALIFALAAAGVLVWTGQVKLPSQGGSPTATIPATPAPPSPEAQLVKMMNDVAAGGGFAATFQEKDLRKWQISEGHKLERFSLPSSDAAFARLTSSVVLDKASVNWPSQGLSTKLPVQFAQAANGKRIQVGVVARAAQTNGSPEVSILFATQQAGNTGWRTFQLDQQFKLYKFVYDILPVEAGYTATPIVVISSDTAGGGKAVELLGTYVKVVKVE